jgi:hypothetical protein
MTVQDDLPHRLIEAWNSHDPRTIAAMTAPDCVWEAPILRRLIQGAGLSEVEQIRWVMCISSDYRFELRSADRSGDNYFLEWVVTGTNDGAYEPFGLDATGLRFEVLGANRLVTDNGLITRGAGYFDLWGLFAQLGLPLHGPFAWPFEAWMLAREQERPAPIE